MVGPEPTSARQQTIGPEKVPSPESTLDTKPTEDRVVNLKLKTLVGLFIGSLSVTLTVAIWIEERRINLLQDRIAVLEHPSSSSTMQPPQTSVEQPASVTALSLLDIGRRQRFYNAGRALGLLRVVGPVPPQPFVLRYREARDNFIQMMNELSFPQEILSAVRQEKITGNREDYYVLKVLEPSRAYIQSNFPPYAVGAFVLGSYIGILEAWVEFGRY
ncbi:MAG TPA: hypothetical protein VHM88_07150, partial [Candidatus Acidoferrales bacterium]|nr:hypothetical protein [Candidatus Acidoferrales bacterium]